LSEVGSKIAYPIIRRAIRGDRSKPFRSFELTLQFLAAGFVILLHFRYTKKDANCSFRSNAGLGRTDFLLTTHAPGSPALNSGQGVARL
jgi:hypothetical protein